MRDESQRALNCLNATPQVVAVEDMGGQKAILTISFRGCDDDAFEIWADLATVRFWFPVGADDQETGA